MNQAGAPTRRALGDRLRRWTGWIRDGWTAVGIGLLMFLVMEWVYRGQHALRRSLSTWEAPEGHPYEGARWYREFRQALDGRHSDGYDPYRAWISKSIVSRHLNVDSAGRRATVQPSSSAGQQLFMLGGSALWGLTARDSFTIPSLVARKLPHHDIKGLSVVNLAEPGYNVTQQTISLLLELRRESVPAVAVYLHGVNDILTAYQNGRPGTVYNQEAIAAQFERPLRTALAKSSRLVGRVAFALSPPDPPAPDPRLCQDVALYYVNTLSAVQALVADYRFVTLFFLQPLAAMSAKPPTPWERSLDSQEADWIRTCTPVIDSLAKAELGSLFMPLHTLFDGDTSTVFIDHGGHVTEQANAKIATQIAAAVANVLTQDDRVGPGTE